jgi:hypothetical protein
MLSEALHVYPIDAGDLLDPSQARTMLLQHPTNIFFADHCIQSMRHKLEREFDNTGPMKYTATITCLIHVTVSETEYIPEVFNVEVRICGN